MSRRAWVAFAAMSVLWGVSYLLIRIAVRNGLTAATVAWLRVALAAVLLMILAWRAGTLGTLRGHGRWLVAYAIVEISIPFPLIAAGEVHVASSLAAIIIASVPLIGAVLALRFDHAERPTPLPRAGSGDRLLRGDRAGRDRCRGQRAGAARRRRDPGGGGRLFDRADDRQARAGRYRSARDDGREPVHGRARAGTVRGPGSPARGCPRQARWGRWRCSACSAPRPRS